MRYDYTSCAGELAAYLDEKVPACWEWHVLRNCSPRIWGQRKFIEEIIVPGMLKILRKREVTHERYRLIMQIHELPGGHAFLLQSTWECDTRSVFGAPYAYKGD